jgi:hypothetical protein
VTFAAGDDYRHGWVAVVLRDERLADARVAILAELVERMAQVEAVGVGITVGLPAVGPRDADVEARRLVGPRRRRAFLTRVREPWKAPDIESARRISLE